MPGRIVGEGGDEAHIGLDECLYVAFFALGFGDSHGAAGVVNGGIPLNPGEGSTGTDDRHDDAVSGLVQAGKRLGDGRFRGGGQVRGNRTGGVQTLSHLAQNILGEEVPHSLLSGGPALAASDEASGTNLRTEDVLIQGDILGAGARIGGAGGYCGVEVHGGPIVVAG